MHKAVPDQRSLFPSCLTREQLPDSVREQALDVLTALLLAATDLKQCGAQSHHRQRAVEHGAARLRSLPQRSPAVFPSA
jgi:hypothetical protein